MNEYHFVFVKKIKKSYIDGRSNYFYNPLIDELSLRIINVKKVECIKVLISCTYIQGHIKKKLLSRGQNISKY